MLSAVALCRGRKHRSGIEQDSRQTRVAFHVENVKDMPFCRRNDARECFGSTFLVLATAAFSSLNYLHEP